MDGSNSGEQKSASERNGLVPLLAFGALLVAVYFGWQALGRRPRPEPFGPWSEANQVAPDPPALAPAVGQAGPAVHDEGEEDVEDEPR